MKIKGIRWWMVSLVTAGLIVNYLARNTLSVAAPALMKDLGISTEQYSHVVVAWQLCYAFMQPVAGYLLDAVGTKIGFAAFALAWSFACAAAAWSTGWQSLAFFRGVLGLTEAAGIPAGVKATTEWFPAQERSVAIGWFNIGSSVGALLAPPLVVWALLHGQWQWAFVIVGVLGIVWSAIWMLAYRHPRDQKLLSDTERDYIVSGQEAQFSAPGSAKLRWTEIVPQPQVLGDRHSARAVRTGLADLQRLDPALHDDRASHEPEGSGAVRVDALPGGGHRCVLGGYLSPFFYKYCHVSLFTSRKMVFVLGAVCMIGPACIGLVASPYTAIALLCVGGFAHPDPVRRAVRHHLRSVVARTKWRPRPAWVAWRVTSAPPLSPRVRRAGHTGRLQPLFVVLAIFDLIAAAVVWVMARSHEEPLARPRPENVAMAAHAR